MTQIECAEAAFISPNFLSAIERGVRNISPPKAAKLAAVLGVDIADLRTGG
jgi:transcriptional regulator with XRE-family HTH domain